ncbi:unnamed protein product [Adineta steineri]|uniref:Uncharacterized protein n=1 Tax=Adineta steineri TaxID=433720 RepID=A0A814PLJ4_9BILA|nr:unnamed protein product [Adineta steineri]
MKEVSHLLPSPNQILNNQLNSISNQDLIESIEPFNELAAYYAQMAIKDLDLNQQHHPLLNACRSLASTLHLEQVVTWHLAHLRLIQLIERFPRLKPFLNILNKYGLHLKDILNGEQNGLDIFVDDEEIRETFQQVKTLVSATKTQQVFHSICQYLQLQYERQTKDDNSFENYRLRIFWLTDSDCSDVLPILDLLLNLSQQTGNQDLTKNNSLIALRRLLVPNGLLLLLELVHVPLYFDLIFCFFDQWWSSSDDNNRAVNNIQQWTTLVEQIEGSNIIESTINQNENIIYSSISVLLTTYKQVSIIFAWQLDQTLLNENNDELAFNQNEELICGTLSLILQTIQKSSPYFYPFVYVLTDHAQFNNDSYLNIIASPFIDLARGLITEYERHRLQLIDLQISLNNNNNNQSIFIYTLIEYMINSRYSSDTCEVVLRLNHTNQNQVQHLTWHYEVLQSNDEQEKSKLEQLSVIPKRDAVQNSFCIYVPQSQTFDLFVQCKLRAVEPTVTYEPSQIIEALLRYNSRQVMGKTVFRITSSDQPSNIKKNQSNNLLEDTICFGILVLLTTYKQVSIIFVWQLDQVALNENNDGLAFKQNEELISGTLS